MMKYSVFAVLIVCIFDVATADPCPVGWHYGTFLNEQNKSVESCYSTYTKNMTRDAALDECKKLNTSREWCGNESTFMQISNSKASMITTLN